MADTARFNKEFYSRGAIDAAVEDWREIGTFTVEDEEAYHVVKLSEMAEPEANEADAALALGEFENYVLGLEVGGRR